MRKLPVIFRADLARPWTGTVTAVFPTLEANPGAMVCYQHIGQHGECSLDWYYSTRPAYPHEYASLLDELRSIYERGEDAVELVVYKRMTGKAARR